VTWLGNHLRGALRKASKVLAVLAEDESAEGPAKKPKPVQAAAPVGPVCCGKPMAKMIHPNTFAFIKYRCKACGNEQDQ
jgi:hypothetical protein